MWYYFIKRSIDIFVAFLLLIVLFPFFIIIAFLIKISDGDKILFKHQRIGKNGKKIWIYKFRTMVENAEEQISYFNEKDKKEFYNNFKLENDFRVTKIGKMLRKYNIDELPQLFNVLIGNMSLVGPRPVVSEEIGKYYVQTKKKLLSVTPGLVGYWTSFDRKQIDYHERAELELYYVEHCSLWFDLQCFIKTLYQLFR